MYKLFGKRLSGKESLMGFSKDFLWGTASSAYQIEGAYNEDGKGISVWDEAANVKGKVHCDENGNVACDHYHRFKEDIKLLKEVGTKVYRFSISWTRIFPDGIGQVNEKGIKFYSELIDELIANGIEPMITVFHWDYPTELYYKGAWLNDDSPEWFENYARTLAEAFSDRVKYWVTINEPQIFIGMSNYYGKFAPFLEHSDRDIIRMTRNVLLGHGRAVSAIREVGGKEMKVGMAPTGMCDVPKSNSPDDIETARRNSFSLAPQFIMSNSWWSDPVLLGKINEEAYEMFGKEMDIITPEDLKVMSEPLDFYAFNIYHSKDTSPEGSVRASNTYQGIPKTMMDWPITPKAMYWASKFFYERYGLPIMISENGMAGLDMVYRDGKVHDEYRIEFIATYVQELKRAADDGIDIMGYMYWSIMDNFEWANGYDKRFGLVYVDYLTQKRTVKESGYWYRKLIESNGEIL